LCTDLHIHTTAEIVVFEHVSPSGTMKVVGAMEKNTTIMKAMGQMIKLPQISAIAQELQKEMLKVLASEE
jgi:hypothetical protein